MIIVRTSTKFLSEILCTWNGRQLYDDDIRKRWDDNKPERNSCKVNNRHVL